MLLQIEATGSRSCLCPRLHGKKGCQSRLNEKWASITNRTPSANGARELPALITLDDEAEAEAAKGQVGEDGLLLRLAHDARPCGVAAELEGQSELGRLDVLLDLQEGQIDVRAERNVRLQEETGAQEVSNILSLSFVPALAKESQSASTRAHQREAAAHLFIYAYCSEIQT